MKNKYKKVIMIFLTVLFTGCDNVETPMPDTAGVNSTAPGGGSTCDQENLQCVAQEEQTDYALYKMNQDGFYLGDVMPYYDHGSGKFYIYYLKDVWNDETHERHPWHGLTTGNFYNYNPISAGEIMACSPDGCDQDYALGTGSVIKKDGTYYGFYTGHNPNYPSGCVSKKEGMMLATSNNLDQKFTKQESFSTIYAPEGLGYDEQDNFRDPFVYFNTENNQYVMLVSARKNVNGIWKGVIAEFVSAYGHGLMNQFFMMVVVIIFL